MTNREHANVAAIRILRGQNEIGSTVRACDSKPNEAGHRMFGQLSARHLLAGEPYMLPGCTQCVALILEALALRGATPRDREMLGIGPLKELTP